MGQMIYGIYGRRGAVENKLVASFLGARMQNIKNVVEATMKGADSEHFSGGNK